jgi:hypothetical protein
MTLLGLIIALVIIGVILWLINSLIPMDPKVKTILNVVVIIVLLLWLLSVFGIVGPLDVPIGHIRR